MRLVDDGGRLPRGRGLGQWSGRGWMEKREKGGEAAGCARGHIVGEGEMGLAPRLLVQNVCNYVILLN